MGNKGGIGIAFEVRARARAPPALLRARAVRPLPRHAHPRARAPSRRRSARRVCCQRAPRRAPEEDRERNRGSRARVGPSGMKLRPSLSLSDYHGSERAARQLVDAPGGAPAARPRRAAARRPRPMVPDGGAPPAAEPTRRRRRRERRARARRPRRARRGGGRRARARGPRGAARARAADGAARAGLAFGAPLREGEAFRPMHKLDKGSDAYDRQEEARAELDRPRASSTRGTTWPRRGGGVGYAAGGGAAEELDFAHDAVAGLRVDHRPGTRASECRSRSTRRAHQARGGGRRQRAQLLALFLDTDQRKSEVCRAIESGVPAGLVL